MQDLNETFESCTAQDECSKTENTQRGNNNHDNKTSQPHHPRHHHQQDDQLIPYNTHLNHVQHYGHVKHKMCE